MGQQQQEIVAGSSALVRRIVVALLVAALLVVMAAAMAGPAFAFENKPSKSQGNALGQLESSFTANGTGGTGSISDGAKDCGRCQGETFRDLAHK
jgi:hypothetical protein